MTELGTRLGGHELAMMSVVVSTYIIVIMDWRDETVSEEIGRSALGRVNIAHVANQTGLILVVTGHDTVSFKTLGDYL